MEGDIDPNAVLVAEINERLDRSDQRLTRIGDGLTELATGLAELNALLTMILGCPEASVA